jgi:hypothetical protein
MPQFDFKSYHYRAMNAASPAEKAAINQELNELYASLSDEDKAEFNKQLDEFLVKTTTRLNSELDSLQP